MLTQCSLFIFDFGNELISIVGVMVKTKLLNILALLRTYLVSRMLIGRVQMQHLFHSPNILTREQYIGCHAIQQWLQYLAHP